MSFRGRIGRALSRASLLAVLVVAVIGLSAVTLSGSAVALDAEEQAFLRIINDYRAAAGLVPLSANSRLNDIARWMSQDMVANDYFGHTDSLGRDPFQRMDDFGYTYNTWRGENLAAGVADAQAAFELWRDSPGHNANLLNPNFKVIGIARAYGSETMYGWYWATEFGGQSEPLPPATTPSPSPSQTLTPSPSPTPNLITEAGSGFRTDPVREPPSWQEIASQGRPWWERLSVLDSHGSVLRTVSYMAEQYLALTPGQ